MSRYVLEFATPAARQIRKLDPQVRSRIRAAIEALCDNPRPAGVKALTGSADLMPRNLDNRVEVVTPVKDAALAAQMVDVIERCLADDTFAWDLRPDGRYERRTGGTHSVHAELIDLATAREAPEES